MEWKVRDSCGTRGQVETPNGAKRQEAHRTPRGKGVPGTENNHFQIPQRLWNQFFIFYLFLW
ncbi:hypothetical protein QUF49_08550 [Fictibacillus sp. b24]|uniref:hypothetical protein n=1 Tax=Fictibacillus sp. b24 TaxID=3055863 RepID=UPI0025A1CAB6|nr:hypothetical protein [Fictibacillus sp. b24]MDM5316038.1 hypothetical protein [Fictibacillus sp. b24]